MAFPFYDILPIFISKWDPKHISKCWMYSYFMHCIIFAVFMCVFLGEGGSEFWQLMFKCFEDNFVVVVLISIRDNFYLVPCVNLIPTIFSEYFPNNSHSISNARASIFGWIRNVSWENLFNTSILYHIKVLIRMQKAFNADLLPKPLYVQQWSTDYGSSYAIKESRK